MRNRIHFGQQLGAGLVVLGICLGLSALSGCEHKERVIDVQTPAVDVKVDKDTGTGDVDVKVDRK
jgi:hypothetical protein